MGGNTPQANTQVPYKTKFVQKRKIPPVFLENRGMAKSLSFALPVVISVHVVEIKFIDIR